MKQFLILILAAVSMTACTKKKNSYTISGDYIIIGRAGGYTMPDAKSTYYLVTSTELREDRTVSSVSPPTNIQQFNFNSARPASEYNVVKDLRNKIPVELLTRNGERIGDMLADAGYTDVRASINGVAYSWKFEGIQDSSSDAVRRFVDSVSVVFR